METVELVKVPDTQAKRMYAIAMNSGYTKDTLKALIGKWGYSHSDEILRGHYDDITNTIKPGSNKPKEA